MISAAQLMNKISRTWSILPNGNTSTRRTIIFSLPAYSFILVALVVSALSQNASAGRVPPEGRKAVAVRVETAPKIDGILDDSSWESAIPISDFIQHEPNEGSPQRNGQWFELSTTLIICIWE